MQAKAEQKACEEKEKAKAISDFTSGAAVAASFTRRVSELLARMQADISAYRAGTVSIETKHHLIFC